MKKIFIVLAFLSFILPLELRAKDENIYHRANNPADYVKLEGISEKEAETLNLRHPYTFTEDQMVDILATLRYSRKALFSDKEKIRSVFEMEYIKKYAPFLVEAFAKATTSQMVFMSVAQKRPLVIVRNDKLTQVRLWVIGSELHMKFVKTEAKLVGDYQAHTTGTRLIEESKGLRIQLDPQEGQKFSFSSTDELILDLNTDFAALADKIEAEDERVEAEEQAKKKRKKKAEQTASSTTPTSSAPPPPALSPVDQKNAETRLTELKKLKDKGLITEQDYNKKKEEILQGM